MKPGAPHDPEHGTVPSAGPAPGCRVPAAQAPGAGKSVPVRPLFLVVCLLTQILLAGSACETRDRSNPFDARNPDTGGEPDLLVAVAGHSEVTLTWDLGLFDDVRSVRLRRSFAGEPEHTVLGQTGRGAGSHMDALVSNGETYTYRLEITGPGQEVLHTATATATPGLSRPWVGDASGRGAARLSPDGRHVVQRIGAFRELMDLQFAIDGSFWAADYRNGAILRYDRSGELLREWRHYGVNTLAVDGKLGLVWAGSFPGRTLTLFDNRGEFVWADSTLGLIEHVEAPLAGGGVWVASRSTGVSRVVLGEVLYNSPDYNWPVAVCPDGHGGVWVVDRGDPSVHLIIPVGPDSMLTRRAQAELVGPRDGATDSSGGLWVADPDRGGVVYIGPDLEERCFIQLGRISSVTWDGPGERLWVASADDGRVLVLEQANGEWIVTAGVTVGGRPAVIEAWW